MNPILQRILVSIGISVVIYLGLAAVVLVGGEVQPVISGWLSTLE